MRVYPKSCSLLATFNLGKWRNSELAWVLNTNNHVARWPRWFDRGAH